MTVQFTEQEYQQLGGLVNFGFIPEIVLCFEISEGWTAQIKPFGGKYVVSIWGNGGYEPLGTERLTLFTLEKASAAIMDYVKQKTSIHDIS